MRIARAALFVVAGLMVGAGGAAAQGDLAKVLVGRWEGEQEYIVNRADDPKRTLVIESVNQVDGKWVANGRFGTPTAMGRVKIAIETSGKDVGLSWTGGSGAQYQLNLLQDKHLVGKMTLTMEQGKSGTHSRDRTVKLEKVK